MISIGKTTFVFFVLATFACNAFHIKRTRLPTTTCHKNQTGSTGLPKSSDSTGSPITIGSLATGGVTTGSAATGSSALPSDLPTTGGSEVSVTTSSPTSSD